MSLEDEVLSIVNRTKGGLTIEAVSLAYAKEMEKSLKAALDKLADDGRITKNPGASAYLTTYHRIPESRRV
jgi:hypothetical protein